jgi:hypothetical protein
MTVAGIACCLGALAAFALAEEKTNPKQTPAARYPDFSKNMKGAKLKPDIAMLKDLRKEAPDKEAIALTKAAVYTIWIINRTNYTIVAFKAGNAAWFNVTPIPRTCDLGNCTDCYNAGKGVPLFAVTCTEPAFNLWVMVRDDQGKLFQVGPATVTPSCEFNGEAVCLDI